LRAGSTRPSGERGFCSKPVARPSPAAALSSQPQQREGSLSLAGIAPLKPACRGQAERVGSAQSTP
jgi:hypothetical protein